jgi:hypothetical protein
MTRTGIWFGTVTKVITGGYQVTVPRYSTTRVFGSTGHPVTYPTALVAGQRVLVGFLENDPDQLVILRPG